MHGQPRIRDLPAEEIAKLRQKGPRLTPAVADLQDFIDEISGIDNADADEMPSELEAAA